MVVSVVDAGPWSGMHALGHGERRMASVRCMHAVCMAVRVTAKNAFFLQICTICGLRKMCAEKLPTMLVQRSIRDRPRVRVCTCLGYNGHDSPPPTHTPPLARRLLQRQSQWIPHQQACLSRRMTSAAAATRPRSMLRCVCARVCARPPQPHMARCYTRCCPPCTRTTRRCPPRTRTCTGWAADERECGRRQSRATAGIGRRRLPIVERWRWRRVRTQAGVCARGCALLPQPHMKRCHT
jgi:hypothetical protein